MNTFAAAYMMSPERLKMHMLKFKFVCLGAVIHIIKHGTKKLFYSFAYCT